MGKWGLEVEGAKELNRTLADIMPAEARRIARRSVVAVAKKVRDTARQNAPRAGGTLRKAIRSAKRKAGRDEANAAVHVTTGNEARNDAFYWFFVEFGTRKQAAQPFIQPTIKEWEPKAPSAFADEWWGQFQKEMEKRARKQAQAAR